MPLSHAELGSLDTHLRDGALVLVPNYRSSDQLTALLCAWRTETGTHSSIQRKPAIIAIDLWLAELWQQLGLGQDNPLLARHVLTGAEEMLLWRKIIREESPDLLLLNEEGTAEAASAALRLLQQWCIPLPEVRRHLLPADSGELPDDREIAWRWLDAFAGYCRSQQLLTFSGLLQEMLGLLNDTGQPFRVALPAALVLWGFDDPPPLYRALLDGIAVRGCPVAPWQRAQGHPQTALHAFTLVGDECLAAAQWAGAVLASEPAAHIGIITADTGLLKNGLVRSFEQVFGAQHELFTRAAPVELAEHAFVHAALAVFNFASEVCDAGEACALLRSPWLRGADAEQDARAELELWLRRRGDLRLRCADLRTLCHDSAKPWHCPVLGEALLALEQLRRRQPASQGLGHWVVYMQQVWQLLLDQQRLAATGNRALQAAWETLQKNLLRAGFLFPALDKPAALALLHGMTKTQGFQEGKRAAPVQLLTPVAAAGLAFTHVWCLQMTEDLWPGTGRPHPYLPLALQKERQLPGCDPALELQKSKALLESIRTRTTRQLVFSHAASDGELPLRRSNLLPPDALTTTEPAAGMPAALHPALALIPPVPLERFADSRVHALSAEPVSGTNALIAHQAACPFRAFAQHRLKVRELPAFSYGLSANVLGNCVHTALQQFWNGMQSSARLAESSPAALQLAIHAALDAALHNVEKQYPLTLTPALKTLEKERLTVLLLDWLEQERQRGPFTVLATEAEVLWHVQNLELRLRIDRIDRHADGTTVVVDYKTGSTAAQNWQEPRPEAPQLLLYRQALDESGRYPPVSALLYAHVNLEERSYKGVGMDDSVYPGIAFAANRKISAADWPGLTAYWQNILQHLAREFLEGYAAVQPQSPASCTYCHLASFCRIAELRRAP
jgi:probable DNA repair protein